jgi:predicted RNase H-like nuclease (RuvC/YqgF family)
VRAGRLALDYREVWEYVYDMTIVNIAAAASQILSNTMNALKIVRERAQMSKDNDLKEHISALYDSLLSLKEAVMRLTQENDELRRKIAELQRPPKKSEPRNSPDT